MTLKTLSTILFLLVFWIANPGYAQDTLQNNLFDLERCLDYGYEHNVQILNAELEEEISKTTVGETRAEGLPQLNGSLNYTNNPAVQQQVIPNFLAPAVYQVLEAEELATTPNGGDFGEIPVGFGTTHTGRGDLVLSQLIFKGSYFVGLQAARTYKELASKEHIKTKIDLTESITKAYYTALINQERIDLLEKNYDRLDTLLYETQMMYENGFAEKIDVDRIKINFNNVKTELSSTRRLIDISYLLLKFQMGMPIDQEIILSGDISEIEFEPKIEEVINFDYNQRIDFSQLQTNKALTQLDMKNNKVQYLPELSAMANYGYNMGTNDAGEILNFDNSWFNYASIGLTMNIPIFDGLRKSYRIQKNKIQYQQQVNQESQLKNSIDLEIEQKQQNLITSTEKLEAQQENMELAENIYNVTKIKFQEGVGSNLEVVEAETNYKEAETNYYNALFDALIAKVELEKALGILLK